MSKPVRTCVGCRKEAGKRGLIRLVRDSTGQVVRDPTGRAPGRGAYLHSDASCVDQAKRRRALERALKGPVSATLWADLTSA